MGIVTRRSFILSGVGLATGAFVVPAEAATGSVALHIATAGFIFGVTGGSGTLTFQGRRYRLSVGGIRAGRSFPGGSSMLHRKGRRIVHQLGSWGHLYPLSHNDKGARPLSRSP